MKSQWITDAELAKVRSRHADIEQAPLIDGVFEVDVPKVEAKAPSIKSVRWEACPCHVGLKNTGLILANDGSLVFREHSKWVGRFRMRCPGSGATWVDEPKAAW